MIPRLITFAAAIRRAAAWPGAQVRRAFTWTVWSKQRFTLAAVALMIVIAGAVTFTLTNIALSVQDATANSPTPTRTASPTTRNLVDLATADPAVPSLTASSGAPSALPATITPEQLTRAFATAWLAGAHRPNTKADHAAWVRELAVYGGSGLAGQLTLTPYRAIPTATIVSVRIDVLMKSATATVTLTDGHLLLVDLMDDPVGWRVHGYHSP